MMLAHERDLEQDAPPAGVLADLSPRSPKAEGATLTHSDSQPSTLNPQLSGNPQPSTINSQGTLNPLESEVIDLFVQLSRLLGQPRSLAEIYGLLFISARPLAMDDLIARLALSKGSASQGLKFLRSLGAVKTVYVPGDRRTHYEAVAELRHLAGRFLRDHVVPHLDQGLDRLDRISAQVKKLPAADRKHVDARVKMLRSWEKNGRRVLPVIARILG